MLYVMPFVLLECDAVAGQEERLLTSFHPALPNIPEELRPRILCSGNLKSCFVHYIYWIMAIRYYSIHGHTYAKCTLKCAFNFSYMIEVH